MIYQVNTLGGAIGDPAFERAACYAHRGYGFLSELQTYWQTPARAPALLQAFDDVQRLFADSGIRAQYVNYCNTGFECWETAYYGANYARLQAVKRRIDPDDVIRHPQSVRL
jgi:hypothetical protein